jgi:hypothetical protein
MIKLTVYRPNNRYIPARPPQIIFVRPSHIMSVKLAVDTDNWIDKDDKVVNPTYTSIGLGTGLELRVVEPVDEVVAQVETADYEYKQSQS